MNNRLRAATALAAILSATAALAEPVSNPNAGAFAAHGTVTDRDGNTGEWAARGTLRDGDFTGELGVEIGANAMLVDLGKGRAYFENGNCILKGENGRDRFEVRGPCDREPYTGSMSGYFDGIGAFTGTFTGAIEWGDAATAATAPAIGVVPTAKLGCGYRERIGGVVAGDIATYENRTSLMVFLQLSPDGAYRTNNSSGRYVKDGEAIRLTSGAYAGAIGRLRADNSGEPAVYFDLDENRHADGVPIADAWNTFCVRQND